ncbi:MAG: TIGR00268 family protein [Nitrospiraceae bacterium]|nr:TIGR00268 family protein [Nitrospiraceae bacterium]|tara:strand:- start:1354 stop:2157 length:804 start_codon:yes stop_codon:yes gene_type:complete
MHNAKIVKYQELQNVIKKMQSVLVAFSGGIDSTLVLKAAYDCLGNHAIAATALSPTLSEHELRDAIRICSDVIGAQHHVITTDQLLDSNFVKNDGQRCYHCKNDLYTKLQKLADQLGIATIVDGTNYDDLHDDRPGIVAAQFFSVRSPLMETKLTKNDVRILAQSTNLPNWNKPASPCLSSRIPRGIPVTYERLDNVAAAEAVLLNEGFHHVRVRWYHDAARIELDVNDFPRLLKEETRNRVLTQLKTLGFRHVTMDIEGYRQGKAY